MASNSNYDVVTIRMSRSELTMPWGFSIQPPCVIRNVEGGSLADKAGLRNGDLVDELQFERNPAYERLHELMESARNELNIIVLREPTEMAARIWKPSVSYGKVPAPMDTFTQQSYNNNVRVSLQHQPLQDQKVYGFNQAPRQFGNSPVAKIDPNASTYMRSEALKLIQETEKPPAQLNNNAPPECFGCGRMVIGLMCNAFGKNLHPDCFQCSTCGSPLAQQGHHFINDKFYCDVHGKQRTNQGPSPPSKTANAHGSIPLKNPSRPFNTATNTYQNPESVVQPNTRYGQALSSANKFNSTNQQTAMRTVQNQQQHAGNFSAAFNRTKVMQKSPAFQRRRKLQKHWPPREMNATQKNAEALRYWKYDFQQADEDVGKLKTLINDFDSGKMAEMDSKIVREEGKNYAKRIIATPERLNQPMQRNPFAWFNAELPSTNSTPQSHTPMSSSLTLEPAKTATDSTNQNSSTQPSSSNTATETPQPNDETHTETSWKFLSQVMEEQDILTESTISSLKSSFSFDSHKKPSVEQVPSDPPTPTAAKPPKMLTRMLSSIQMSTPQVQIVSQNSAQKDAENETKKTKFNSDENKVRIQQATKQQSFSESAPENRLHQSDLNSQKPKIATKKSAQPKIATKKSAQPNFAIQKPIQESTTNLKSTSPIHKSLDEFVEIERRVLEEENQAALSKFNELAQLTNELENAKLTNKKVKTEPKMETNRCYELIKPLDDIFNEQYPMSVDFVPSAEENLRSRMLPIEQLPRPNDFNGWKPQQQTHQFLQPPTFFSHFRPVADFSSRENSTDLSSLADLPPQMPELMTLSDRFAPYNSSLSQSSRSLDDCLLKTGEFLTFLANIGLTGADQEPNRRNDIQIWSKSMDVNRNFFPNNFNQPPIQEQQTPPAQPLFNPPQDLNQQRQHGQLFNSGGQPRCEHCGKEISGSFVLATGKTWCPEHFTCANVACNRRLLDCGFVEESGKKYCEKCFETLIAPICAKCGLPITADCLNALQKQWHPECFVCVHCRQTFGNTAFYLENGQPYCEKDWNQLFTTKCVSCKFPIEAGDRWIEALGSSFHSNCFNCFSCQTNLEGQNFYQRDGHPFCRAHA